MDNDDAVMLACWALPILLALLPKWSACKWITAAGIAVIFIWSFVMLRSEVDYPPPAIFISVILWFVAAWYHWRDPARIWLECNRGHKE
jgi:hypothetical protein